MAIVDTQRILNESPKKRLIIAYDSLKKEYTESAALDYKSIYSEQPLAFLLENSRLIFAEPFYGYDYYKEAVLGSKENCIFTEYANELEKINTFMEETEGKMSDDQRALYVELAGDLEQKISDEKNTILIAKYALESAHNKEDIQKLSNMLYFAHNNPDDPYLESVQDEISKLFAEKIANNDASLLLYAPYAMEASNNTIDLSTITDRYLLEAEESVLNSDLTRFFTIMNKLTTSKTYMESVMNIPNTKVRDMLSISGKENLKHDLSNYVTESVSNLETFYSSPKSAVNDLFIEAEEYELDADERYALSSDRKKVECSIYEGVLDMISFEHSLCDTPETTLISGYSLFDEGTTLADAFSKTALLYAEAAKPDDLDDEDLDDLDDDTDIPDRPEETQSKKVNAPKAKNLANKVQNKAMDLEAKQSKLMAKTKQKGQEVSNAVKAVAQLPANVFNDIKGQIKKADEKDTDKRKKFISEPGFRKHAVKNLKLAILYGGAAQVNMAMLPFVAVTRHFSKERDRRIRNELISDVEVNIKVCEEKINDANANNDMQEKYRLMRIKAKLENELVRVKTNTKYL